MRTQPEKPNARLAPGAGKFSIVSGTNQSDSTEVKHLQDLSGLNADIATAEEFERVLALKAYRVRKLILNLKAKRDALEDLSSAAIDRRAAA